MDSKEVKAESKTYRVPLVRRAEDSVGWELVRLHIKGNSVVKTELLHGPDVRRICLSLAMAEMTRN